MTGSRKQCAAAAMTISCIGGIFSSPLKDKVELSLAGQRQSSQAAGASLMVSQVAWQDTVAHCERLHPRMRHLVCRSETEIKWEFKRWISELSLSFPPCMLTGEF